MRSARICLLTLLLLPWGRPPTVAAEPVAPPPPDRYKVVVRYRIAAARNERVAQFRAMVRYLESLGFKKDPGPFGEEEDTSLTRITGTLATDATGKASVKARRFLLDNRVKTVLLLPDGYELPGEADKPVRVQLDLVPGLPLDRQRLLAEQTRDRVKPFGFREAVGYYNRGHTRMVGTIPAGQLETLLTDIRWQPSGWLLPEQPFVELPPPIRDVAPIQVVEVVREPGGEAVAGKQLPPLEQPTKEPEPAEKITADLRALLEQKEAAAKLERLEVILSFTPLPDERDWAAALTRRAPSLVIEGRLGPIVTVRARPEQAPALAELPIVSTIRRPRPALIALRPAAGKPAENLRVLRGSGLERLHAHGYKGAGLRVAIVAGDFRGYEPYLGKGLPARVAYVDLTQERSPSLRPDPYPDDGMTVGHGTQCALALGLAAPEAQLTLIRIDPAAPYQLRDVASYLNGDLVRSYDIENRETQLRREADELADRRAELLRERQAIINNFGQDVESVKRRQAHLQKQARLEEDQRLHERYYTALQRLIAERFGLKGTQVVASALVWNEGYPLAGSGPLSGYLDDRPFRGAVWFQSAGNTRGQGWSGLFRDRDGDRVMEFSAAPEPSRPDLWTTELSFLGWAPFGDKIAPELPAGADVRIALQWQEPHDSAFAHDGEDPYRRPVATLRLVVLRQLDPDGKTRPADDLDVVAWSSGLATRLENRPDAATYEVVVEFKAATAGRYALRVEGIVPEGIRPLGLAAAPGVQPGWELRPRLFVQVVDAASRKAGRAVFRDYFTSDLGSLGVPGDARQVITVGAANLTGAMQSYSAGGPPDARDLLFKPNVLGYDDLHFGQVTEAYGSDLAAAFGAGLMASRFSAGVRPRDFLESAHTRPGNVLRAPQIKGGR
jgi:hypothetical protein